MFIVSVMMIFCIPTIALYSIVNNSALLNEKEKETKSDMFVCRGFGVFLIAMIIYYRKLFIITPLTYLWELTVDNAKTKLFTSFIIIVFGLIYYVFSLLSDRDKYAFYKYETLNKILKYSFVTEQVCLILLMLFGGASGYIWKNILIITIFNCYLIPICDSRKIFIQKSNGMIFDDTIIFTKFYGPEEITNIEKSGNSLVVSVDTDKIIIKNISEEVLAELNDKYWKKENIVTIPEKKISPDKESDRGKLIKFIIGAGLQIVFFWLLGIYFIYKKYPISYSVFVIGGSIPELIFIIYYFRKEWRRLTNNK